MIGDLASNMLSHGDRLRHVKVEVARAPGRGIAFRDGRAPMHWDLLDGDSSVAKEFMSRVKCFVRGGKLPQRPTSSRAFSVANHLCPLQGFSFRSSSRSTA